VEAVAAGVVVAAVVDVVAVEGAEDNRDKKRL
jgi:hypothetical protein